MDWDVARQSQTIQTMLDDLGIEDDDDCENTVPFFNGEVTGPVFKKSFGLDEREYVLRKILYV